MPRMSTITVRTGTATELIEIDRGRKTIWDLRVMHTGTEAECKEYCEAFGYVQKPDSNIFGYYYAHPESGAVLLFV
jgi:hypothetical protein